MISKYFYNQKFVLKQFEQVEEKLFRLEAIKNEAVKEIIALVEFRFNMHYEERCTSRNGIDYYFNGSKVVPDTDRGRFSIELNFIRTDGIKTDESLPPMIFGSFSAKKLLFGEINLHIDELTFKK